MQIQLNTPAAVHARSISLSPVQTAHYNWEIVQFVSYMIIVGIIAAKVKIFTFTGQFCIHPHLLYNIGADSCSCKAKESTICEKLGERFLLITIFGCATSEWVKSMKSLSETQVCFTVVSSTKTRVRCHEESIRKIKTQHYRSRQEAADKD